MSQHHVLKHYLREIGVHTPISLLFEHPQETALPDNDVASIQPPQPETSNLKTLAKQAAQCERCSLSQGRSCIVFGDGHEHADVLLVGEAPTAQDEQNQQVFSGDAGVLLQAMFDTPAFAHIHCYHMPLIKCSTPEHRAPSQDELTACQTWLHQHIALMQPKVIILMGRMAAQALLQSDAPLRALHGQWHSYQGIDTWVTYHPSHLLRAPRQKQVAWSDMQTILNKLR